LSFQPMRMAEPMEGVRNKELGTIAEELTLS
jgi:hypothetical protein